MNVCMKQIYKSVTVLDSTYIVAFSFKKGKCHFNSKLTQVFKVISFQKIVN